MDGLGAFYCAVARTIYPASATQVLMQESHGLQLHAMLFGPVCRHVRVYDLHGCPNDADKALVSCSPALLECKAHPDRDFLGKVSAAPSHVRLPCKSSQTLSWIMLWLTCQISVSVH